MGVSYRRDVEWIDPRRIYVKFSGDEACVVVLLRNVGIGLAVLHASEIDLSGVGLGAVRRCFAKPQRVPPGETTRVSVICSYPVPDQIIDAAST